MLDLIIRGGRVVAPEGVAEMDIGIQGGQIAVVAQAGSLDIEAGRTIDASGKIVLPGGIEPHTHIGIPVPTNWAGALKLSPSHPRPPAAPRLSAESLPSWTSREASPFNPAKPRPSARSPSR